MQSSKTIIVGAGPMGLLVGAELARRGRRVELIDGGAGGRERAWAVVPAEWGRRLPAACCREESLPLDLILPGGHPVSTPARASLVDLAALRSEWGAVARQAGVSVRSGRVSEALRHDGGVSGVRLEGGEECPAGLTVDASGEGVLLPELPGTALPGGRWTAADREPWAVARVAVSPRRAQTAWVGRAQLRLDLAGPGALAWCCATRDGSSVWAAATAGRGTTRSAACEVLARAIEPLEPGEGELAVQWLPSRRPLDVPATRGLVVVGAAAAWNDALMGVSLPALQGAASRLGAALAVAREAAAAEQGPLHPVSVAIQRGPGATWSARALVRHWLDRLGSPGREGLVAAGVTGPGAWAAAFAGGPLLGVSALVRGRGRRLPVPWRAATWRELARLQRLRLHHARYPRRFDRFELDRWQATQEGLLAG